MSWYCSLAPGHPVHHDYHANEYGVPLHDDNALFERLCLEIFQAGLSWELILKRRPGIVAAFEGFDVATVAAYDAERQQALLEDARIIRNRLKVAAIVHNAQVVQALQAASGSFATWLAAHHPLQKAEWVKLFRKTFRFTGPEVVNELLMSTGYLPGSHAEDCPVGQVLACRTDVPHQQAAAQGFIYAS
ncbi:DNA-3-methyladenine glycosylase I [Insolitispirillum peregrinum]|uniref:DNA-3-methyladenine glycosylase I n=1 Tax=Insolitispirillum peregrinum TaxID=80876 RepID=UPI00361F86C2